VTRKDFDVVAAWSVDRLSRSLPDLLSLLGEIHAKGIGLYLHQQGLDTTTPAGRAMFSMLGVFSEFERAMIQERVKAGLARVKAEGKTLGRPRTSPETENAIREALRQGLSRRKIAAEFGIGMSVLQRIADSLNGALETPETSIASNIHHLVPRAA